MDAMTETTNMVVCMITHPMTFVDDTLQQFGILTSIVAHHKKGGFDAIMSKRIKNKWRGLGDGTVIEGQIY